MTEGVSALDALSPAIILETGENQVPTAENHSMAIFSAAFQSNSTEYQNLVSMTTPDPATVAPDSDVIEDDNYSFILIPLAVLLGIIGLSALVYLMARNRRRLAHIYCKRKYERKFTFGDRSDATMEKGEGYYDFDDPTECLLKGKLQIDNSYESTMRKELYT